MTPHLPLALRAVGFLAALFTAVISTLAQTAGTGSVEGRVFNPATGEYLELARVTVEGTSLEAMTDASGYYRLNNVPAGAARVRIFHTAVVVQTQPANVAAGRSTSLDFQMVSLRSASPGAPGDPIQLSTFVVGTSKEMDGSAIAINTQRFAPNVMSVVSTDEYTGMTEGGVGELLKAVAGMNVDIGGGGEPYLISMNGVPPGNVPISVGGFSLANGTAGTSRQVGIEQISMNNMSRIEVAYTPTPETTGSALAGTVNMVPRSAFERSKPVYTLSGYFGMRDHELSFRKTPGPVNKPEEKIRPGIDVSAIVPVNSRFGFTFSASTSSIYTGGDFIQMGWRGTVLPTNGAALPNTAFDQPYLTDFQYGDQPKLTKRLSWGATMDFKLSAHDRVSLGLSRSFIDFYSNNRAVQFFVTRVAPGAYGPTFTRGSGGTGSGEIRSTNGVGVFGGRVLMPTLTWTHNGPVYKAEAGAGASHSTRHNKNIYNGHFANVQARRLNIAIAYDGIVPQRPGTIAVTDGVSGAALDPYSLSTYTINTATGAALYNTDLQRSVYGNLRRDLTVARLPLTIKGGFDVRQIIRDNRNEQSTYTFVGRDRVAGTADDNALIARDESFSTRTPPFGFARTDWVSNHRLWDYWKANPAEFTLNEAQKHTGSTAQSKYAEETISSLYLRGDLSALEGRLRFVGGLRTEQTNVEGQGQLIDATRNFQRDANGNVIRGANGQPLPITTDALQTALLTTIDRGLHSKKEYLRLFPSLNVAYNIRENLIARAGYYHSVGRPNLVQYAGALTLPNTENDPSPTNRITVNNAGIKAWTARTYKATLEYYFEKVGLVSVAAFQRDIKNFFGSTVFLPSPQFLALYGLEPSVYGDYEVSTQYNLDTPVRMSGIDVNYKQALTFLPHWARGVQVYVNASALRATGDDANNFQGYVPRTINWGLSLSRPTYSLQVKWNYNSRKRLGPIAAGPSIGPGTYTWGAERLLVDVIGQYTFYRNWSVFANLNNVTDAPAEQEVSGPSTPGYARYRQQTNYGSIWTIGVKATF